eukprot:3338088-Amphidinium_carterae.1
MRHIQRNGGAPKPFLSRILRDLRLADNGRNAHELELPPEAVGTEVTTSWAWASARDGSHQIFRVMWLKN